MERKCSQTIRVDFPIDMFYGTECTVRIPKITNMIKRIRLVTDASEIIVEKIELMTEYETIETLYGDYIHVENNFKTPCEKRSKLQELISSGYLEIPFETTKNGLFVFGDLFIRVLFKNTKTSKINCYFLIDYYITHEPPKTPFIQKTTYVSRFNSVVNSASRVKMNVYVPGPVYEVYFTIRDEDGNYVNAIKNIGLYFPNERFNIAGDYLRYAEPIKRNGIFPEDHMYMYSFGVDDFSNGNTYFGEESYFIIDLYNNNKEYTIDIWTKSHDFIYVKDDGIKRMFISNEMLIELNVENDSIQNIPMTMSYINYSDTVQIFYQSDYNIKDVKIVDTNMYNYVILQNYILFTKIDSKNIEYYANILFSSDGFVDTMCYFNIIGNNLFTNKLNNNQNGMTPTNIDSSQVFHYVYGNTFDISNNVFTSNINSFVIDQDKNYIFSTYTDTTSNISGTSDSFNGPGSIFAKYDKNMNLLSYSTFLNANVCLNSDGSSYAVYSNGKSTNGIDAGNSILILDSIDGSYSSGRVMSSSSNINNTNFGINTDRSFIFSSNVLTIVSNVLQTTNQVKTLKDKPVWAFMFSNKSYISDNSSTFTSNGYCIKSENWNIKISNVINSSINMNMIKDPVINNIYALCGYNNTKPILTGYDIKQGSGFFVVKIDINGNIKFVLSFIGSILNAYQMVDTVTGMYFITVQTQVSSLLSVYKNGTLTYSDTGKYQFFVIDNFGDINNDNIDTNYLFSIVRDDYSKSLQTSTYFNQPTLKNYNNYYWIYAISGTTNNTLLLDSIYPSKYGVFFASTAINVNSNIYDIKGDTNINISTSSRNGYLFKSDLNGIYKNFSRITNLNSTNFYIISRSNSSYIYTLLTTSSGISNVFNSNGSNTSVLNSLYTNNLVLLKFDQIQNSYSNWIMNIENAQGNTMSTDKNGNIYVTGKKMSANSSNIFINNTKVATLPSTVGTTSSFFVKLNQIDSFVNYAFVDNTHIDTDLCWVSADNNLNLYFSSRKGWESSNINGISSNILPETGCRTSTFIVKFDQNCNYASWYSVLSLNTGFNKSIGNVQLMCLKSNESNIFFSYNSDNYSGNLYINGTTVQTIPSSSTLAGGGSIKLSNDTLAWYNTIEGGVLTSVWGIDVDKYDNLYLTGQKQDGSMNIRVNNIIRGTIPSTLADTGYVLRINSDGSYSNCLGYVDTFRFDGLRYVNLDENGDFFVSGLIYQFPVALDKSLYVYDKYGYVTTKTIDSYSTNYTALIKYNSNFTLNKITL